MIGAEIFKYGAIVMFFVLIAVRRIYFSGDDKCRNRMDEIWQRKEECRKELEKLEKEVKLSEKRVEARTVLEVERRTYYDKLVKDRIMRESFVQRNEDTRSAFFKYNTHFEEASSVRRDLEKWDIINEEYFDVLGKKISTSVSYVERERMRQADRENLKFDESLRSPHTFTKDMWNYKIYSR